MEKKLIDIMGRTCSGKSTIISELGKLGYNSLPEIPRTILNLRKSFGFVGDEVLAKQTLMYKFQLELENSCEGLVFLERGFPSFFLYTKYFLGYIPEEFDSNIGFSPRYYKVFELEELPFVQDGTRIESGDEEARQIQNLVRKSYLENGYTPIYVPRFCEDEEESLKRRVEFILKNLD